LEEEITEGGGELSKVPTPFGVEEEGIIIIIDNHNSFFENTSCHV